MGNYCYRSKNWTFFATVNTIYHEKGRGQDLTR